MPVKSRRLTSSLRYMIRQNFIKSNLDEIHRTLRVREEELGDMIYRSVYTEEQERERAASTHMTQRFYVSLARGGTAIIYTSTPRPYAHYITAPPEFNDRLIALHGEREAYERAERLLQRRVDAVLSSVTTTKRLVEAWPAIEPHIPEEPAPVSTGPDLTALIRDVEEAVLEAGGEVDES